MRKFNQRNLNQDVLDKAKFAFKPTPITPELSRDRIMFEAGSVKAIEWIENEINKKQSEAKVIAPEAAMLPDSKEGFLRRMSKGEAT